MNKGGADNVSFFHQFFVLLVGCSTECDGHKFGQGYAEECGQCVNDEQCHHINGTCLNGCKLGYKGQQCKQGDLECNQCNTERT